MDLFVELGTDCNACGSATWELEGHHVTFSVYGPDEAKTQDELTHRACVEVIVTSAVGQHTLKETELECYLITFMERLIDVKSFPRTKISGRLCIVTGEASHPKTVAAALNAISLALLQSGLPLRATVAAVCTSIEDTPVLDALHNSSSRVLEGKLENALEARYDPVYVALDAKPSWFLELYPTGKVPVLITNQGKVIGESIVIMKFLDSLCDPDASLLERCGEAEFTKAGDYISKLSTPIFKIAFHKDTSSSVVESLHESCSELNTVFKETYFSGPKLSLADLLLLPHLDLLELALAYAESVEVAHVKEFDSSDPHYQSWPKLIDYMQTMRKLPFVMEIRNPVSAVARYWESMRPKLSLADLLLLPHLDLLELALAYAESVEVAHVKEFDSSDPHYQSWPKLIDYMQTMRKLPFVMEIRNPVSAVARYWESMRSGHPNPDL
ncbi:uncharacterized protein DEA37_0008051 [Paragonimus westermani]|uniref:Glutathione S-transferase n=1 Tax=Paragonimus westermani TaxID=34504 RepID=A0A5J4NLI1_9TREM|nr:uncharacterized protein DEA37_0008051 [Paragonimus westermani]